MRRIYKLVVLIGGVLLLVTCENALLGTVRVMVEESTSPLQVGFQPEPGTYTLPQSIQLSANKDGATIRYTTDGSDPTATTGTIYDGPIAVGASTTVRARAFKELYSDSEIALGAFTIPFGGQTKRYSTSPGVADDFGWAVAIDGEYAIVGSPEGEPDAWRGAVYIYHRLGPDEWDAGVKIVSPNPADEQNFGFDVDIDGDYAIVGSSTWTGVTSAFIFHRTGPDNTWDAGMKIDSPYPAQAGNFGCSVSISGDYAVIGAYLEDGNNADSGAAYIFHRTASGWDEYTRITGADTLALNNFGRSVSIDGDYAIVGAPSYDAIGGGADGCGAAFMYHRTGTNAWEEGPKLLAGATTEAGASLGWAVDISGDYAIVGAPYEDAVIEVPISQAGAAYTFHRIDINTWEMVSHLLATDPQPGDNFGRAVAISGDYVVGGAYWETDRTGAIYSFHRTTVDTWDAGPTAKWTASDGGTMEFFGHSVGMDGMYAIVGAYGCDGPGGQAGAGAAYILH